MTSSNRLLTNERPGYEGKVSSYDNKVNPSDALTLKRLQRHQMEEMFTLKMIRMKRWTKDHIPPPRMPDNTLEAF